MKDTTSLAEMERALMLALADESSDSGFIRDEDSGGSPIANAVLKGHWISVLQSETSQSLLKALDQSKNEEELFEKFNAFVLSADFSQLLETCSTGVAALQLFVEANWTGWNCPENVQVPLLNVNSNLLESEIICVDGESIPTVVKFPELILLARLIFSSKTKSVLNKNWVYLWWKFRSVWIHQQTLSDRTETLHEEALALIDQITENEEWQARSRRDETLAVNLFVRFQLEVGQFHVHFFDVAKLEECIKVCCEKTGLEYQETGAMGKRTKFQQHDLAQMTLDISSRDKEVSKTENKDLPLDVKLDDEVRLEKVKFADRDSEKNFNLDVLDQAILLSAFFLKLKVQPKDSLTQEEVMPYLEPILTSKTTSWAMKMSALLSRSKLESDSRRTVERSMLQIEELVDSVRLPKAEASHHDRLQFLYCSNLPPFWDLEHVLCKALQSLGSTKAALDIALRLELWEEMIHCYHMLQLRHKAAEVIKKRLEKKETPLLFCMMGDATDEIEWYHKALELSNNRSARAYRSMGVFYYYRKNYAEAAENFENSVKLNPYQPNTLLRLGYSAMQLENWTLAAQTYRKFCSYESDVR